MKEAIGNSMLFNIIIIFVFILVLSLIGSLSYSKAYKVKTKLVNIVEKYKGYNPDNTDMVDEINQLLDNAGYSIRNDCTDRADGSTLLTNGGNTDYNYCVYRYDSSKGNYYKIVVYMQFDIPVVGGRIKFPITGETSIIYNIE